MDELCESNLVKFAWILLWTLWAWMRIYSCFGGFVWVFFILVELFCKFTAFCKIYPLLCSSHWLLMKMIQYISFISSWAHRKGGLEAKFTQSSPLLCSFCADAFLVMCCCFLSGGLAVLQDALHVMYPLCDSISISCTPLWAHSCRLYPLQLLLAAPALLSVKVGRSSLLSGAAAAVTCWNF